MAAFGYVGGGPEAPRLGLNGLPGGRYRREMACERDHTLEAGPPSRVLQLKSLTTVFFDPIDYLAAERGLEATTIQLAARSAGIGQGTYYKLYESKEACLREAFERCANRVFARVAEAAAVSEGGEGRIEAGLAELLDLLAADADVAKLLLGGILEGDLSCRAARERTLARFAGLLTAGEQAAPRGGLAWLGAAAIARTLALRFAGDDALPKAQMLGELLGLASRVRAGTAVEQPIVIEDRGAELDGQSLEATQRARRVAKRERAKLNQRQRILAAMVESAGATGYREAAMREVLRRAGVSVPVFYAHFAGKQECLLAAF